MSNGDPILSSEAVKSAARDCRFELVGLARAEALDSAPLDRWLAAGYGADMDWMSRRRSERLDPTRVLDGARTVIALGIPYRRPDGERSRFASYARGRDYHYAHRDRMRALRRRLLKLDPTIETYACVDTGVAMEKVWAERAGLGWIGKNTLLITPRNGSWLTLSVMFIDRAVDRFDEPHPNLCGECDRCVRGCPTRAFPTPGVLDSRRCISYQSIENRGDVPEELRRGFAGRVFGCDVCQDLCPYNRGDIPVGDSRFEPRALALLSPAELAGLSREELDRLSAGMAAARARPEGLKRNALLALGAARDASARPVMEEACSDPAATVREAATWALRRLRG